MNGDGDRNEEETDDDLLSGGEDEKGNTGAPDMGEDRPPEPFEVPEGDGSDG